MYKYYHSESFCPQLERKIFMICYRYLSDDSKPSNDIRLERPKTVQVQHAEAVTFHMQDIKAPIQLKILLIPYISIIPFLGVQGQDNLLLVARIG